MLEQREKRLAELTSHPGLCASCRFLDLIRSKRSVFVLCGKAKNDGALAKYPAIPVLSCPGHEK